MKSQNNYSDFIQRFKLLIQKRSDLIVTTLSNIFTMRLIGNKTHCDLAEIAIAEFINQYMYDFRSDHTGKDLYRSKSYEEDIKIINELTKKEFSVSLKAYGQGPLQLSTDKQSRMFCLLDEQKSNHITDESIIQEFFKTTAFADFHNINILPLIYDEKNKKCNILVFDYRKAQDNTSQILFEESGRGRKHPVFRFYDADKNYICEVRYGGTDANALQRGLWTDTKKGLNYFESVTGGWIDYSHNLILVQLFSKALVSSCLGHKIALEKIEQDIERLKQQKKNESKLK